MSKNYPLKDDPDTIRMGWEILVHKYLYYEKAENVLEDHEYDILEREWEERTGRKAPVDYPRDKPACKHIITAHGRLAAVKFVMWNIRERREQIAEWRKKYV